MRIRYGHTEAHFDYPAASFSRATEGDSEHTEERHALREPVAWVAALCKLTRAGGPRNKEGNSLSLVPVASLALD